MTKFKTLFSNKLTVLGRWSGVMNHHRKDRGLELSEFRTRCIRQGEIHEFLVCATPKDLTQPINDVAYLGFGEILHGGVVEIGDDVYLGDTLFGKILGFDETHMPNHYNIVIESKKPITGFAFGLNPADMFSIVMGKEKNAKHKETK